MITIDDYKNAATQCHAVNRPNETAFILLAAATYMLDRENEKADKQSERQELRQMVADMMSNYSYAAPPIVDNISNGGDIVAYTGDTDFAKAVKGKHINDVIALFDELMTAVSVHKRNLYTATLNRLYDLK